MRIALGNDHRGVDFKLRLSEMLTQLGHTIVNVGTDSTDAVDYPDIAAAVARQVASGAAERGILVCGTGIGMAIAANKIPGVRATTCHDEVTAEICRRHNDVNILCLSEDLAAAQATERIVQVWLDTAFDGGRHQRRLDKVAELERACTESTSNAS